MSGRNKQRMHAAVLSHTCVHRLTLSKLRCPLEALSLLLPDEGALAPILV